MSVKVSIVMPIYNSSKYLGHSLGGLLKQTLKDIEVICVNDGSTDDSLSIINYYARQDDRIRIINGTNHGYGYAMNRGIEKASGEYIGILEPDDFCDNNMFESLYKIAKENDLDVAKSSFYEYSEKNGLNTYNHNLSIVECGIVTSALENPVTITMPGCSIWSAIYRKDFLLNNHIKFNETPGASFQDTAFYLKVLFYAKRIMFIKEPYLHYRVDNDNSSTNSTGKIFSVCDEFKNIETELNENQELKNIFIKYLQIKKLDTYKWNLDRIAPEYKKVFSDRVALEFIKAEFEGNLDRSLLGENRNNVLNMFIDNYYHYIELENKEAELNHIKNSDMYKLSLKYYKVRDAIFSDNSIFRKLLKKIKNSF